MRIFIGMILGCLLMGIGLYLHDSAVASPSADGTQAGTSNQIVNWDVAARKWGDLKETAHIAWLKLQTLDDSSPSKGT